MATMLISTDREWIVHAAEVHYREWQSLLDILPSTSVGAELRNRRNALYQKKIKARKSLRDIRDAWTKGDEATQRETKRTWVEQINSDAAWETKEKGEKRILWLEFIESLQLGY
jgi:hypothetical protein